MRNPFRYFKTSPEIIRLAVRRYIRYPLSLRRGEDQPFERGIDICHETARFAAGHASLCNLFNLSRHLNRRDIFKRDRSAAWAEWRQLAA